MRISYFGFAQEQSAEKCVWCRLVVGDHIGRGRGVIYPIKIASGVTKTLGQGMFTPAIIGLAIICLLLGMALALHFRAIILIPVISVAVAMAVGVGVARGDAAGSIGLSATIIALGLQLGYSLWLGVWFFAVVVHDNRNQSASVASSLGQRRLH